MALSGDDEWQPKDLSKITPDYWMRRPCDQYYEEYKECTKLKARLFQYYVHGSVFDCTQWDKDYQDCTKWLEKRDEEALLSVVESEKVRHRNRLKAHVENTVWEKRDGPPEDWNKPLPEFMEKHKNSYLANQLKIDREGYFTEVKELCSIQ